MGVLDLKRGVGDAEVALEEGLELLTPPVAVVAGPDEDVRGQSGEPGRDRPDVKVVNLDDARYARQTPADLGRVDSLRRGLQEDPRRVAEDRPGAHRV